MAKVQRFKFTRQLKYYLQMNEEYNGLFQGTLVA